MSENGTSANTAGNGRKVVVLGGVRTPFAKAGTQLAAASAVDLGCKVAVELMHRTGVSFDAVDEVCFGNVAQPADAPNIARVISLRAGFPVPTPAFTVHRNCASGMQAVTTACEKIRAGSANLMLVGGVESMSQIPVLYPKSFQNKIFDLARARKWFQKIGALVRFRLRDLKPVFGLEVGLNDPVCGLNMGETAENLAHEFGITRRQQDEFALESHLRTARAIEAGFFDDEIISVYPRPKFAELHEDVGPRANQTVEALSKLRPYFDRRFGSVTVGNSCPVTDGACALLLACEDTAHQLGIEPLGTIGDYSYAGCPPSRMGLGPVFATSKLLEKTGLQFADFDRIELNEAFAAQVIACERAFQSDDFARTELGRDEAIGELGRTRLNVNGGAIALGHPVGATGARLVLTMLQELRSSNASRGLVTLCVGGGQGGALVVERNRAEVGEERNAA